MPITGYNEKQKSRERLEPVAAGQWWKNQEEKSSFVFIMWIKDES